MANPVFNDRVAEDARILEGEPMSVNGAINKTVILFICLFLSALLTWSLSADGYTDKAGMLTTLGAIIGFVLALVISFTRKAMHILAPIYALCEGLFIGGISSVYASEYSGIVTQAVLATFAVLIVMLSLYKMNIISCSEKFRSVVLTSTISVGLVYLIQIIASLFGRGIPQIFTTSPIGIGFSLIIVIIAALNLIIDFDFIERGAMNMFEKKYEWYGAFGLMVTLVWLYLEILRLLAKLNSRD